MQNGVDKIDVIQQMSRDRGMAAGSEQAVVPARSYRRNQLAKSRTEGRGSAHHFMRKALQMHRGGGLKGEQMPDLWIFAAGALRRRDQPPVGRSGFRGRLKVHPKILLNGTSAPDLCGNLTRSVRSGRSARSPRTDSIQ